MKPRLLDFLVCPKDLTELKMVTWSFRPIHLSEANRKIANQMQIDQEKISKEVFEGILVNHQSKIIYPIIDGIPRLLVFSSPAMRAFCAKHKDRLARELPGYELPDFEVDHREKEGARAFQNQIFINDWESSKEEKAVIDALVKSLELMLDAQNRPLKNQSLLDVGLGLGGIAHGFAQSQRCELVGMDVSHLVDTVQKAIGTYPFLHLVQASILAPPCKPFTFDLVYSYGGLNRCSSAKLGMAKMSELPKRQGRLSLWFDDDKGQTMSKLQRILLKTEKWLRPMISHLPRRIRAYAIMTCMPLYLMHQRLYSEHYPQLSLIEGVKGAMVVAQQRLEMQIKQGLDDEDVQRWFEMHGYDSLRLFKERVHPFLLPLTLWNCTGVEGVRT